MKKLFAVLLAVALLCSVISGCAAQTVPESQADPAPAASTAPASDASPADPEPEEPTVDVLTEAAMRYFAEFPDDRHMISVADLFAKMDAGEDMLIIDVRQADAYAEGHLKGAVNVPYGPAVAENLEKIPDDVMLYVNCYSGQTSSQVVALLAMAGKYATNITGGFNGGISKTEGYENYIETEVNELPDETYPVDETIAAAIADYFQEATTGNFSSFNISVDSLFELVDAESEDYTILSIRRADDYEQGHIAGAINIPFGKGMQEQFSEIPTDKPVIVYCYSGQTASQTMPVLRMLGYEAYNLAGGMGNADAGTGWLGKGYPVVTD